MTSLRDTGAPTARPAHERRMDVSGTAMGDAPGASGLRRAGPAPPGPVSSAVGERHVQSERQAERRLSVDEGPARLHKRPDPGPAS